MKKLVLVCAAAAVLFSCKKQLSPEPSRTNDTYLRTVVAQLKNSLSVTDFQNLDTGTAFLTKPGSSTTYYLRLAFLGRPISADFVLLKTDSAGNIQNGTIVHLDNSTKPGTDQFNGALKIRSLDGQSLLQSNIINGRIPRRPLTSSPRMITTLPAPDADWLDPAVVVGYPSGPSNGPSISLDGLFGAAGYTGSGGYSGGSGDQAHPGGGSGGGGNNPGTASGSGNDNTAGGNPTTAPQNPSVGIQYVSYGPLNPADRPTTPSGLAGVVMTEAVDLETDYSNSIPVVDIRKFFNCFDLIPSVGATYTIQLCADLPINTLPDASMNFSGRINAGHTFLIVTKSGSGMSITQSFGFYPSTAPSVWDPFSTLPSAIKDNRGQEINASISMSISPDQFNAIKASAVNLSTQAYTLDKFNCTDYALTVFNAARTTSLTIQPYVLRQAGIVMSNGMSSPSITVTINNSPQMLYKQLQAMKNNGGSEAANITLDLTHNLKAPISHGECN